MSNDPHPHHQSAGRCSGTSCWPVLGYDRERAQRADPEAAVDANLTFASDHLDATLKNLAVAIDGLWDAVEIGGHYASEFIATATNLCRMHHELAAIRASIDASANDDQPYFIAETH